MAKIPNKGAPQFTSRALRPGGEGVSPPKQKPFNLSVGAPNTKPPKFGAKMPSMGKGMAPPFKGNTKRGR